MSPTASMSSDESRQFAVLIARAWADPQLMAAYKRDPKAVLSGAGIEMGDREAPEIPARPADLGSQASNNMAISSSASSVSTVTCPCSACSASCACVKADVSESQMEAMMKLADDPQGRAAARALTATWDVRLGATAS
jgi:hypothetical protein